jgi:signal transduction histidine kinase
MFIHLSSVKAQYRGLSIFDGSNGLKQNTITCITQDSSGKIWLGTFSGLHVFDGQKFTKFPCENPNTRLVIRSILNQNNRVFAGTEQGLYELDYQSKKMILRFESKTNPNYITLLDADNDYLYFIINSNGELKSYHFESKKTESLYRFPGKFDNLTFFVENNHVYAIQKQKIFHFSLKEKTADSFDISLSKPEKMWRTGKSVIISNHAGIFISNKSFSDFQKHPFSDSVMLNKHFNIFTLNEGYALACDNHPGIKLFDNNHQLTYTIHSGQLGFEREFTASNTNSLIQDPFNNLWVGMDGTGLLHIHRNFIHFNLQPAPLLKNIWTRCYLESNDSLIIGTFEEGIHILNKNLLFTIPYPANSFSNIYSMSLKNNLLFCGTNLGIWQLNLNNSKWVQIKHPLIQEFRFQQVEQFNENELVFVSNQLKYLIKYSLEDNSISKLGDFEYPIKFFCAEKSGYWLHFSNNQTSFFSSTTFEKPEFSRHGLNVNIVKALGSDYLALATDIGLIVTNKSLETLFHFNSLNGLNDEYLISLEMASENIIWAASYSGLHRFDLTSKQVKNYNLKHGLQDNEFNYNASIKLKNGHLVFGGVKGSNILTDDPFSSSPVSNNLYLESIENKGENVQYSMHTPLKLNYDNFAIKLSLGITDLSQVNELFYKIGIKSKNDTQWIDIGHQREFYLQKLTPGSYQILGIASREPGNWDTPVELCKLYIKPPYYKTRWFILLMALLPSIIIGYVIYTRSKIKSATLLIELKKQQAIERTRQQIAEDLHDDLGAELTRISIMSQKIAGQHSELKPVLNEIKNTSMDISGKLKNIIWATYPDPGTVADLFQKIRDYAESLSENDKCKLHVKIKVNSLNTKIHAELSQNMLLLAKEALNNSLKYANAENLYLELTFDGDQLFMNIKDDGKGFDANTNKGKGLSNMKMRAGKLNGKIIIESNHTTGTNISFVCTIKGE